MTRQTVAERVLAGAGEAFTDRAGPALSSLTQALTEALDDVDELLTDDGRGWPLLADLDDTPHPSWLGQVAGTTLPGGLDTDAQRAYLRTRAADRRGTPTALVEAVRAVLVGGRRVELAERSGSPWQVTVRIYAAEAPTTAAGDVDTATVLAAAASQKPVGLVLDLVVLTGATYAHLRDVHGPTYATFAQDFPTYALARDHTPGEYPDPGTLPPPDPDPDPDPEPEPEPDPGSTYGTAVYGSDVYTDPDSPGPSPSSAYGSATYDTARYA